MYRASCERRVSSVGRRATRACSARLRSPTFINSINSGGKVQLWYRDAHEARASACPLVQCLFWMIPNKTGRAFPWRKYVEFCYAYGVSCTILVRRDRSTVRCSRAHAWLVQQSRSPVRLDVIRMSYEWCRMHNNSEICMHACCSSVGRVGSRWMHGSIVN
jgi:hypothetical protein